MHELYDELVEVCDMLSNELAKTNAKLEKSGGEMSVGDLDYVDKLTHAIKSVKTTKAMMESDYSHGDHDGYSYTMGGRHSYAQRRDNMGRYSRDAHKMVRELHELMEEAPDERTRQEFKHFISKIESM